MRTSRVAGVVVLSVELMTAGAVLGRSQQNQNQRYPPVTAPRDPFNQPRVDGAERDPLAGRMQEQLAKNRNNERQKRLVSDTEKLLSLATELKEQVDKTDKNTLSVDVIKKADEIEKLAHSVKERMKG